MSVYDKIRLGDCIYVQSDFVTPESVALRIFYRATAEGEFKEAWAQNGGRGDLCIDLRAWEAMLEVARKTLADCHD